MLEASSSGQPLVSVIIPYYNRPDLLPRALRSIERQTYRNIEIIVVDDASRCSPEPLVAALGPERHAVVVRHGINRGPGAARNTGIDTAAGAFVTFLDSDDEYDPGKIENQVFEILKGPPDKVFCASSTVICYGEGRGEKTCDPWDPSRERLASFLFIACGTVTVNAMMVSTALARAVRFCEALKDFEDNLFAILCCEKADRVLFVESARSRYYNDGRDDQLTRTTSQADAAEFLRHCRGALTEREFLGYRVKITGAMLLFSDPLRFCLYAVRGIARGVFTPRRVAGLVYGFLKGARRPSRQDAAA